MKSKSLGYIEGWSSVFINTALFGFKYWAGTRFGSIAMIADSWHTLSDTLTSVVVIIGFWMSSRPADKAHPFGHGRSEAIGSVVIATLLAVVGFTFFKEAVLRLQKAQSASFGMSAVIIFLASLSIKEGLARFSIWAGRKINSSSLIADGWHHRSDAIASGLIVAGFLVGRFFWWIDGALGIGVSLLIFYAAFDIMRSSFNILLGEKPSEELVKKIYALIRSDSPAATHFHHFHIHRYGDRAELTFHLDFPADMSLRDAHDFASRIETLIRRELRYETTIHIEPSL